MVYSPLAVRYCVIELTDINVLLFRGCKYAEKLNELLKPYAFSIHKQVQICMTMTECVLT